MIFPFALLGDLRTEFSFPEIVDCFDELMSVLLLKMIKLLNIMLSKIQPLKIKFILFIEKRSLGVAFTDNDTLDYNRI